MKERGLMKEPILKLNRKLPLNGDPQGWGSGEQEILGTCTESVLVRVVAHKEAIEKMASSLFDLIILSPMVLHLSNLFQLAQSRNLPMSMLFTAALIQKLGGAFLRYWLKPAFSRKTVDD
jgi:hypothetical protein